MVPFLADPPLCVNPVALGSYSPGSIKGEALEGEIRALQEKGAVEPAPPNPGYYSRMFVVPKATGGWRPIIDLSLLNKSIVKTKFKMETVQSVLRSVRRNDWMVSIDLKDAYLQIPIHPLSRRYLRFVSQGNLWQFKVLPFGITTAPQVFTRVMAPVSVIAHRLGIRLLRYLDDWLILASSVEEAIWARDQILEICADLGIVVNLEKSTLTPSQVATYLGVRIDSGALRASPVPLRIERFFSIVEEFLSSELQPAKSWRILLGHLASLIALVPGGRLRMRSLQLALRSSWDFLDETVLVAWDTPSLEDLRWWCDRGRLERGISMLTPLPDQMFWSDASDQGWGANLSDEFASGVWSAEEALLSINVRELLAVEKGLLAFLHLLQGSVVAVFCDNTTAVSYLRRQGGLLSPLLNSVAQRILRWAEEQQMTLMPQFVIGKVNVVADALSRPNQILGSEWSLHQEVFDEISRKWPVTVDLFATSLNRKLSVYFAPMSDPMAAGTDAMLQPWDNLQVYAFPPFVLVRQVLNKLRSSLNTEMTLIAPFWSQREWFPNLLDLLVEIPVRLPARPDLLRQPHFHRFHHNPSALKLHAWRLFSAPPVQQGSLAEWLSKLQEPDVSQQG